MAFRRGIGGILIGGNVVTVAVDDLPFPLFTAVDVGDAKFRGLGRTAVDRQVRAFEADNVGKIPAGTGGKKFKTVSSALGEP